MLRTLTLFFAVIRTSESSVFQDRFGIRFGSVVISRDYYDIDYMPYYHAPFIPRYNVDQTNQKIHTIHETKSSDDYKDNAHALAEDSEEDSEVQEEETYLDYGELRVIDSTVTELNQIKGTIWYQDLEQEDDLEQNNETDWNQDNKTSWNQDYIDDLEQNNVTDINQNNQTTGYQDYIDDLEQNNVTDTNQNNQTTGNQDFIDDLQQNNVTDINQNNQTTGYQVYIDDLEQNNVTDINQNNQTTGNQDFIDDLEQNNVTDINQNNQTIGNQDYIDDLEQNNQTEKSTLNDEAQSSTLNTKNNEAQSNQPGEDPTGQTSAGQDNHTGVTQSSQPNSGNKVKVKSSVRKCCQFGYGYDVKEEKCTYTAKTFDPPVYKDYRFVKNFRVTHNFKFAIGMPRCSSEQEMKLTPVSDISEVFHVSTAGLLVVEVPHSRSYTSLTLYTQAYCMDTFITGINQTKFSAMICLKEKIEKDVQYYTLSCICMLVTCILIMLRVILFAWLPELRTLHGMILMAYLISFLIGIFLLASTQLLFERNYITQDICTYFAFLIYFSTLSAFFWRNVMCYDIWWTFCGKRAFTSRGACSRARFSCYSMYAFGAPTAFTVLLAALEFSDFNRHPLMPKLRVQGCFLYGYSKLLYLYGPVIILFIVNIIFSTITALKISAIKKETKNVLQTNESNTHDQQKATKRFTLYLKLFAAMAFLEINWILEVISVFYPEAASILHISDIYNLLVPLIIFVNFVCRKKTWRMIKKRYRQVKGLPPVEVTTSRTQNSQIQDEGPVNKI